MPEVSVQVNGRTYRVACGPGDEPRLQALGEQLNVRIAELVRRFGQAGESQLLLVAGLMLMDELDEAQRHLTGRPQDEESAAVIDGVAARIEQLATAMEGRARADAAFFSDVQSSYDAPYDPGPGPGPGAGFAPVAE